ncbi:MAG: beta strand repeat-containing protein, partial [Bacteroidota bacterium]
GGTAPYTYSWSNGASSEDLSGVTGGTYSVTVTDNAGATTTASAVVSYLPVSNANSGNNYATIQAAINAATAGDVINVCAGTYTENLTINTSGLNIKGPNSGLNNANGTRVAEAIITSASSTTSLIAVGSGVTSYTIDGFKLVGANYTSPSTAPNQGNIIWASGATQSNILNNILEISSSLTGTKRYVWLGGPSASLSGNTSISGNISHNSFTAVGSGSGFAGITTQIWSQNLNITGNKFASMKGQRNLLMNGPTATVVISNNEFFTSDDAGARELIRFEQGSPSVMSGGATIQNNTFSITGTGKAFSTSSAVNYGANISVTNNDFTNVGGASINHGGSGTIAATCNWWGAQCGPVPGDIVGSANSTPWISAGTDGNAAVGFQPSGSCNGGTAVVATGTQVNITSCYGDSNGSIDLSVSGGIAPYTYAWSNGATTEDISSLAAGTYNVTAKDVCGLAVNQGTASFTITQPTQITGSGAVTSNYNGSQLSCDTSTDGSITVTATGGTGSLQYSIDGGSYQASNLFSGLAAGVHTLSVKDANNCVVSLSSVTITAPAAISGSGVVSSNYNGSQLSCATSTDGAITVTATGGTGSLQYSLNGGAYQSSAVFSGLAAGTYAVSVKDANNCTFAAGSVTITAPAAISGSGVVSSNYNGSQLSCATSTDGQITVTATGGTGTLSYSIDGGSYQAGNVFSGLAAGVHTLSVKDANNCVVSLSSVTITAPAAISGSGAVTSNYNGSQISCNGATNGQITVTANGGTGSLQYSLNGGSYQSSNVFSGLAAGTYAVSVKDANNCTFAAGSVTITAPAVLTATAVSSGNILCFSSTATITVSAVGGTGPYTGTGANTVTAGTYNYTVTDANGCTAAANSVSVLYYPISNVNTGVGYNDIQVAINAATAGDTINVCAGTYSQNIVVSKPLTLRGAQRGVKATDLARTGGESVLNGVGNSSSYVVTIEADNVTIDGFTVDIRNSARDGINTRVASVAKPGDPSIGAYRTNIALRNNRITANLPSRTNQVNGIVFGEHTSNNTQSINAEIANVTIEDNHINMVTTSSTATPSNGSITGARGIVFTNMFRNGGASMVYTGLVVDDNTVFSTYQTILTAQLQTRVVGASFTNNLIGNSRSGPSLAQLYNSTFSGNTIQDITPGSDYYSNLAGAYLGVVNSTVSNNVFQRIGGTAGLVLAGGRSADPVYFPASSNSTISNNSFTCNDVALSPLASYTSNILVESNTVSAAVNVNGWLTGRQAGTTGANASTLTVTNNSMLNAGFASGVNALAISQESANTTLPATCNWYGTLNANTIASRMSGGVSISPWLTDGTDSNTS